MLALAAAVEVEEEEEEAAGLEMPLAGVKLEEEQDSMAVTGLGGRACRIGGAAVLLDGELELQDATKAVSLFCRREWMESVREGLLSESRAVECNEGEVARGECGSGAMGR